MLAETCVEVPPCGCVASGAGCVGSLAHFAANVQTSDRKTIARVGSVVIRNERSSSGVVASS